MKKELKQQIIADLTSQLKEKPNFYIADVEGLNAEATAKLRRECFKREIELKVVKNTLFAKALEESGIEDAAQLQSVLTGSSAIMFAQTPNGPAKLIKQFSAGDGKGKPELKAALVQECAYVGANQLDVLCNIKSKNELIADIVAILQSPAKNVISALTSQGGGKIAGLVKTLSERE